MPSRLLGRVRRSCSGTTAIEFALIAPILMTMLIGLTDFGIAFYEKMQVQAAAQAGAEYAARHGFGTSAVKGAVTAATGLAAISASPDPSQSCGCASGTTITAAACGSTCTGGATAGTYVTVNAQAKYATIFNYPGLASPLTLTAQTVMRIQ
jgi:Flp pilus assembly protein TadG